MHLRITETVICNTHMPIRLFDGVHLLIKVLTTFFFAFGID